MSEKVSSVAMGGVLLFTTLKKNDPVCTNDHEKIKQICSNCGLFNKSNGKKPEIIMYRKKRYKDYIGYVYKTPLGMSFQDKAHILQGGLSLDISLDDIKQIRINKYLIQ